LVRLFSPTAVSERVVFENGPDECDWSGDIPDQTSKPVLGVLALQPRSQKCCPAVGKQDYNQPSQPFTMKPTHTYA